MKIVMASDVFLDADGGIVTSIAAQKSDLERLGHEVYLFTPGLVQPRDETIKVVPTSRFLSFILKMTGIPFAKGVSEVERYIRDELDRIGAPDVIHVHGEMMTSVAAMKVAKERKIRLVQTMHGREDIAISRNFPPVINTFVSFVLRRLHAKHIPHKKQIKRDNKLAQTRATKNMWQIMVNHANFADMAITPSKHFGEKLRYYGVTRPMEVVSNGVSDDEIGAIGEIKPRVLGKDEKLKIVWLSRLSNEKRPMEFIEAIRKANVPVKIDIYGRGVLEEKMRRYISRHGLAGSIKMHGHTNHTKMLRVAQNGHISIVNSYGFDNQPMTLLEGVAIGLPAIIVDPDLCEVMPKGGYVLAKSPSVDSMVEVLRSIEGNPSKINEMSKAMIAGRKQALQSEQTRKLLAVYKSIS